MSDRWTDMLEELARERAELDRVSHAAARLTARATSTDRLITVTVNARGLLIDLAIEPLALRRYRADQLSSAITELVDDADRRIRDKRNELLTAAVQETTDYSDVHAVPERDGHETSEDDPVLGTGGGFR